MKKSALLTYLLEYAVALAKESGKKGLTADYFIAAVLKLTLQQMNGDQTADILNDNESLSEFSAVRELLDKYKIDYKGALESLLSLPGDNSFSSMVDEMVFSKFAFSSEARAKKLNKSVIDTCVYLSLVFDEPTDAIKKLVVGETKPDKGSTPEFDINSILGKSTHTVSDTVASEKSEPDAESEKDDGGIRGFSGLVEETKRVQQLLLDKVYGQDHAVNSFVSGYFQSRLAARSRQDNKKPRATFLFAGPPGVGKTFLAESAAEALGRPFCRYDMSEYSNKEANIEFCGSDKVYKDAKAGNVTEFVENNPECVLLFDEIEKAHVNVIYLFLQILDAGRLRDNFTDREVSFTNTVIIFTTNAGKNLYADGSVSNLSAVPRKKVLKALSTDVNPETNIPLFPAAICSRFASGNIVMFNYLGVNNLYKIAHREFEKNTEGFEKTTGIKLEIDDKVSTAIILSEGGKADARTIKGRADALFHEELYELFRLLPGERSVVEGLRRIKINVALDRNDTDIASMFVDIDKPEVLIFADQGLFEGIALPFDGIVCHTANNVEDAKEILFNNDISVILCDICCGINSSGRRLLNAEDIDSEGRDFLDYVMARYTIPVYLLEKTAGSISRDELLSFAKLGVQDVIAIGEQSRDQLGAVVAEKCSIAYQQSNMHRLARENKVVSFKTSQSVSEDGETAEISLFGFKKSLSTDIEDSHSVLDRGSKPNVRFEDVIGAEDAKRELEYFIEYLKDPMRCVRIGARTPKGVLLWGPPGTGKTMLAKAMACESNATFIAAEGNQFLKRYVGEGPEAVHALFASARKYAPAILFIDEIDAIGKDRGSLGEGDHTGDILTAFLTEMDGFNTDTTKPVFVLAATNFNVTPGRGRSLDEALLRRFDRRVYVDLPTKEERKRFLHAKASKAKGKMVKLSEEQIENIALRSTGMSLAELDSVYEMALRNAILSRSGMVDDAAFDEAFETYNGGEKRKKNDRASLERTARHEAGHALIYWLGGQTPSYLTIVARGDHGGYMMRSENEDKGVYTKSELLNMIRTSLAGRAAELVYYGSEEGISTGASGDLRSATGTAERMICNYGMDSEIGLSYIDQKDPNRSQLDDVRHRVNTILSDELSKTVEIISNNRAAIDRMVEALMEKDHLKSDEIHAIFSSVISR